MLPSALEPQRPAAVSRGASPGEPSSAIERRFDPPVTRRPGWRQDLVDTERGLVMGFRGGAGISGQLFVGVIVVIAGVIFGLSALHWLLVTLMLTALLVCELFRQAILSLEVPPEACGEPESRTRSEAAGLVLAAMTVARVGTASGLVILFAERLMQLLGGP
jgi:hypothetical protein